MHTPASQFKGNPGEGQINFKETNSSNNTATHGKDNVTDKKISQIYGMRETIQADDFIAREMATDNMNQQYVSFAGLGKSQESQAVSSRKVTDEKEPDFLKTAP